MKPYLHGLISVKKFGGKPEDYQAIHDFFDQTKAHVPDMRHRAILHNSFGIFLCEQFFGVTIENSDGKIVSVRDVGEQHMLDDLGYIPTVQDYLRHLPMLDWLGGPKRRKGQKADEVYTRCQPPEEPEAEPAPAPPAPKPSEGPAGAAAQQELAKPVLDWEKLLEDARKRREDWDKAQGIARPQGYPWDLLDRTGVQQPFDTMIVRD